MIRRIINPLVEIAFLLVVALVPIQLSYHFWPAYSALYGVRHSLLASSLYLSDLAIGVFLGLWVVQLFLWPLRFSTKLVVLLGLLPVIFLISGIFSANLSLALYKTAKLTEFALLALYVSACKLDKLKGWLAAAIAGGQLMVSLIAIGEFMTQASLGLQWIGEYRFSVATPGIAQVTLSGQQLLRPYATFPHPNVLAGFLSLSLPLTLLAIFRSKGGIRRYALVVVALLSMLALLLTFSRSGWLTFILEVMVGVFLMWQRVKEGVLGITRQYPRLAAVLFLVLLASGVLALNLMGERFLAIFSTDSHSLRLRAKLMVASWEMFKTAPLTGVGPGHFLLYLPDFFQVQEVIRFFTPVHNIFLLQLTETGILGLVALLILTLAALSSAFCLKPPEEKALVVGQVLGLLVIGNLDHYLFSLQQGQLLFWLILGWALRGQKFKSGTIKAWIKS